MTTEEYIRDERFKAFGACIHEYGKDKITQWYRADELPRILSTYDWSVTAVLAHNAQFDRTFLETTFPSLPPKAWGCLMYDVDWDKEEISSRKLEYIAYKFGFFHEGHRAINDCLAGVHLLAQKLPKSQEPVLKELLTQSTAIRFKLYAVNSPYDSKELLKARGYRWSMNQNDKYRAWSIEVTEDVSNEPSSYIATGLPPPAENATKSEFVVPFAYQ